MTPVSPFLTDLYQLTMACAYWKEGIHERPAAFHLFFRQAPFGGAFAVSCGLHRVVELLRDFRFAKDEIDWLGELTGNDGGPLFESGFLTWLGELELSCDLDAVAEGTVLFPGEPMLRVTGPIVQGQLLETPLLNLLNFPTLIATKAARVCHAAGDAPVIEFGLRRAQGPDGGVTASRAAFVGGCAATSNVAAGRLYDLPVRGTHAHSWVSCFEEESQAFESWARAMPNNCIFLVDTYDSRQGIGNAIRAGEKLREAGHEMIGIRLDSGDLRELGHEARRQLDEAGFPDAIIVASNDLDEHRIETLRRQGSPIGVWGVGTRLATAWDQPALGGVYKLTAVGEGEGWRPRVKLSEDRAKSNHSGRQQIRRFEADGSFLLDALYDLDLGLAEGCTLVEASGRRREVPSGAAGEDLLQPVLRGGELVLTPPSARQARERAQDQLQRLPADTLRLLDPKPFPVALEASYRELEDRLLAEAGRMARDTELGARACT